MRCNVPFVKYGGLKFLEAAHVKDLLAILKWADNPKNQPAAYRVLQLLPGMGPANAARCFHAQTLAAYSWQALQQFKPPASAKEGWSELCELMQQLAAEPGTADNTAPTPAGGASWHGQVALARKWYAPHLARLHEAAEQREADLEQLELISARYPSRERFVTELTLDPPSATGDLAGDGILDEDYLILSTVHSAKGQEWDSVFVLNVTDGNFPNEFSVGDSAQIEEERRLLYVAMTRAKSQLHLTVPLQFSVTQQAKHGDKHVFGTRSRFVNEPLLGTMHQHFHGSTQADSRRLTPQSNKTVDVAARLAALF